LSALDKKTLSESDICDLFISPALKSAGWDQITQIRREVTVHGFRSSFRDWAGNVSNFPREVTETALAPDKAEQAYRRSDALEKRRKLMEAWAVYCEPHKVENVLTLRGIAGR
jgi:hypothetical protein